MSRADDRAAGPVVGIVGGGQLARMLAEAATPMGIHVRVLAAPGDEGADEVIPDVQVGAPDDPDALRSFAATVDVVTFDHENVDHATLAALEAEGVAVRPGVGTLRFSDKAHQRVAFAAAGLPVPPFAVIDPVADRTTAGAMAEAFAAEHGDAGGRIVAKASRGGYDGRGVWMLSTRRAARLPGRLRRRAPGAGADAAARSGGRGARRSSTVGADRHVAGARDGAGRRHVRRGVPARADRRRTGRARRQRSAPGWPR